MFKKRIFSLWKTESKSLLQQLTPAKWRFNHNTLNLTKYYSDFHFTDISFDIDKCTLCGVCLRICDQKCFEIQKEHFTITMKGCSSCGLCADVCPEKAIIMEENYKTRKKLFFLFTKKCHVCNNLLIHYVNMMVFDL